MKDDRNAHVAEERRKVGNTSQRRTKRLATLQVSLEGRILVASSLAFLSFADLWPPLLLFLFRALRLPYFPSFAGLFLFVLCDCPISPFRWLIPLRSLRLPHFSLLLAYSFSFSSSPSFLFFAALRSFTFSFPVSLTYLAGLIFLPFLILFVYVISLSHRLIWPALHFSPFRSLRVSHISLFHFDRPCSYSLFVLLVSLVSSFADICQSLISFSFRYPRLSHFPLLPDSLLSLDYSKKEKKKQDWSVKIFFL